MINLNFDEMGKTELRAACKAAGVSYSKLNNDGMRAALRAAYAETEQEETPTDEATTPSNADAAPAATPFMFHTSPTQEPAQQLAQAESAPVVTTVAPAADPAPADAAAPAAAEKPVKVARPARPQQNGVKMPGEGGVCRRVWDWMDEHKEATAADVRTWATEAGLNPNNAQIERSQWRKFHGLNKTA